MPERPRHTKSTETSIRNKRKAIDGNVDKTKDAIVNQHSLYSVGKWLRCRHCSGKSLETTVLKKGSRSKNYWTMRKCDLLIVRNVRRRVEGGTFEYLMYPTVEHHTLHAGDDVADQPQPNTTDDAEDQICEECGDSNYLTEVVKCSGCTVSCCNCCRKHYDCMWCKHFFCVLL